MIDRQRKRQLMIGGGWVDSASQDTYFIFSPATGERLWEMQQATVEDVDDAVTAAQRAFEARESASPFERAEWCERIAGEIEHRTDEFALAITLEQGKPFADAVAEVAIAVEGFRLSAREVMRLRTEVIPVRDASKRVFTVRRPKGVYAVITPWNFPLNIPVEYLGPALASGNAVVWKPAPSTAGVAMLLADCIMNSGVPEGLINLVTGQSIELGRHLVSHSGVIGVGFTGSSAVGKQIETMASGKHLILELGGNGPVIVLDDADIELSAKAIASASFSNAGQSCAAAGRVLCDSSIYWEFAERLIKETETLVVGLPTDEATKMGPCHSAGVRDRTFFHVEDAVSRGAKIAYGGSSLTGYPTDLYIEPTVLTNVSTDALVNVEETFGPVAPIVSVNGEEEALRVADMSPLGLSSAVFTQDIGRGIRVAERMRSGQVVINASSNYWEPHLPFGGWAGKDSGIGRLGVSDAVHAMTNVQSIALQVGN